MSNLDVQSSDEPVNPPASEADLAVYRSIAKSFLRGNYRVEGLNVGDDMVYGMLKYAAPDVPSKSNLTINMVRDFIERTAITKQEREAMYQEFADRVARGEVSGNFSGDWRDDTSVAVSMNINPRTQTNLVTVTNGEVANGTLCVTKHDIEQVIRNMKAALNGMLALDEKAHPPVVGDPGVCRKVREVRDAYEAVALADEVLDTHFPPRD